MYTKEEENLIVLSALNELPSSTRLALLSRAAGRETENNLDFSVKTLPQGVYNMVKDKLRDAEFRRRTIENLEAKGIKTVTYISEDYPVSLKNIPEPPFVLYCRGDTKLLKTNCFSVVGSRRSSAAALSLCKSICADLTSAFTVVTGMAEGADSAAVSGALPSGKIISVLANGFDYVYPAVNAGLIEKVALNGLLITEYPPDVQPRKYNFPYRNRIIAGLSRGTLVVSAGKKSGALITADYATEYGRDVFAFPYSVGVASGAGCNALIKDGAYLTENILDIFTVFGLDLEKSEKRPSLTPDEAAVLDVLKVTGEGFLPEVAQKLKMLPFQLIPIFTMLEMKGLVVRLGGNRYGIVH